jgi:hypothetical protein
MMEYRVVRRASGVFGFTGTGFERLVNREAGGGAVEVGGSAATGAGGFVEDVLGGDFFFFLRFMTVPMGVLALLNMWHMSASNTTL